MKRTIFLASVLLLSYWKGIAQNSNTLHTDAIVIDTHNDVLSNQLESGFDIGRKQENGNFDLIRAKKGGLDAQVFSIWCGENYGKGKAFAHANRQIDSLYAAIHRNADKMVLVSTAKELNQAVKQDKLAAMIGVEGGHMIEDRLDYLDSLAHRGMVYLTLTWNNSTSWATSAADETTHPEKLPHIGLSKLGKDIVQRLNQSGVMVDVSHVGEKTFYDVLAVSTKPVIASHSCAYALNPSRRNLKDEQIKALAKNGGVVFVNFYSGFIDSTFAKKENEFLNRHKKELDSLSARLGGEFNAKIKLYETYKTEYRVIRPPLSLLIHHIDYIAKLVGVDYVGIGADFDGAESYPLQMDDVSFYPNITLELQKLGYSTKDIKKVLGGNFLRVFKANRGS